MNNILIVDDDPVICSLLKSYLSLKKYNVTCATHLEEALNVIAEKTFNIVLTDMKMPGIAGHEIIRKILAVKSDLKLIAMSGDTSYDNLPANLKTSIPFLRKPFRLQEVENLILMLNNGD